MTPEQAFALIPHLRQQIAQAEWERDKAEAERDELQRKINRVRALCDEADGNAVVVEHICRPHHY